MICKTIYSVQLRRIRDDSITPHKWKLAWCLVEEVFMPAYNETTSIISYIVATFPDNALTCEVTNEMLEEAMNHLVFDTRNGDCWTGEINLPPPCDTAKFQLETLPQLEAEAFSKLLLTILCGMVLGVLSVVAYIMYSCR